MAFKFFDELPLSYVVLGMSDRRAILPNDQDFSQGRHVPGCRTFPRDASSPEAEQALLYHSRWAGHNLTRLPEDAA